MGGPSGYCAGKETAVDRRCDIRCESDAAEDREEPYHNSRIDADEESKGGSEGSEYTDQWTVFYRGAGRASEAKSSGLESF